MVLITKDIEIAVFGIVDVVGKLKTPITIGKTKPWGHAIECNVVIWWRLHYELVATVSAFKSLILTFIHVSLYTMSPVT